MASNLGGGLPGISPTQTMNNKKDSNQTMIRKILRDSWNNKQAQASINGYGRVTTPFRAVNNLGDYLGRQAYVCGGSNQVNANKPGWKGRIGSIISQCDTTGVAASVTNNRYVADSSNYTTFKKQDAIAKNYNDIAFVGDRSNGSYVALMAVRRF
uniref:Uncharacterized protein n=1 Tax=viral metagenome TaxID=1070528 RepID=A0A6C0I4J0_9ZZZZ